MRHAEFEECLSHEKFIQSIKHAFDVAGQPVFEYVDVRSEQPDDDPRDHVVPTVGETNSGGLLSRLAESAPGSMIYPQRSAAPPHLFHPHLLHLSLIHI